VSVTSCMLIVWVSVVAASSWFVEVVTRPIVVSVLGTDVSDRISATLTVVSLAPTTASAVITETS
jgi:hypothetical protein